MKLNCEYEVKVKLKMKLMPTLSYYLLKSFLEWGKSLELKGLLVQMKPGQGFLCQGASIEAYVVSDTSCQIASYATTDKTRLCFSNLRKFILTAAQVE